MDRVAIISDVHGNLEALKTVLDDIKSRGIRRVFCLGDTIAKGTHQQECIDLVRQNCEVVLRGNCEEYSVGEVDLTNRTQLEKNRIVWNTGKLNDETVKYLKSLPYAHEFYMSGRLVRLVHAHPAVIDRFIGNIDTIERLYELFLPSENTPSDKKADILIYGHIHTPYIQKIYNRMIANAGSVGNTVDVFRNDEKDGDVRNTTVANYLVLSGVFGSQDINDMISCEVVNLSYDVEKELSDNADNIELDEYEKEMREGRYRDMVRTHQSFELRGIDKDKI